MEALTRQQRQVPRELVLLVGHLTEFEQFDGRLAVHRALLGQRDAQAHPGRRHQEQTWTPQHASDGGRGRVGGAGRVGGRGRVGEHDRGNLVPQQMAVELRNPHRQAVRVDIDAKRHHRVAHQPATCRQAERHSRRAQEQADPGDVH